MSSQEANKDRVRRLLDGVWNNEDPDIADEIVHEDYLVRGRELPMDMQGPALYKAMAEGTRSAFDELHYELEDVIAEGDKVVARWTMTGTHTGRVFGLAPTDEAIEVTGIEIDRFEEGKLVESWIQTDEMGILKQIGGLPAPDE